MENVSEMTKNFERHKYVAKISYQMIRSIVADSMLWDTSEDMKDFEIPEEKIKEWHDKFWSFDVTEWKPRPNMYLGDGNYSTNQLNDVLEIMADDLRHEIAEYLKAMTTPKNEKEV
jgi:hypothetical protein